jgi:hypothetical protein
MKTASNLHYVLIPDSQALFVVKDRVDEVNPAFVRLVQECKHHCSLTLVIPETVRGEIVYQKVREAQTAAKRLREGLATLTALTGHATETLPTDAELKAKIEAKFDAWMQSVDATIAPNVISEKAWAKIIDDATWRHPPFEHSDDGKHEKGFRDALIKSSVVALAKSNKGVTHAFVSDDALLTKAIESEKLENVRVFESVKLFAGHVSLVRESIDQKLAIALQANAQKTFYEDKNSKCIFFRDAIDKRIREKFGTQLLFPSVTPVEGFAALLKPKSNAMVQVVWVQSGEGKIWLRGTTFAGRPKPNHFEWKSRLLYTGLFQAVNNAYLVPQLRKSLFEVTWTSRIKDSEITEAQLVEQPFTLVESVFTMTNAEEAKQHGHEMPNQPQMTWLTALTNFAGDLQKISAAQVKSPPSSS